MFMKAKGGVEDSVCVCVCMHVVCITIKCTYKITMKSNLLKVGVNCLFLLKTNAHIS